VTIPRMDASPRLRQRPLLTVVTATMASTVAALPVWLVGALSIFMAEEFRFGGTELGRSVSIYFGTAGLVAWSAGGLAERLGSRRSILLATAASLVATLGVAVLARHWLHIALGLVVAGMGSSLMLPATNLAIARAAPISRMGLSFGIKQASVPFATFIAGSSIPLLGLRVGWRAAFFLVAGLALALLAVSGRWLPEAGRVPSTTASDETKATVVTDVDRSVPRSMALLGVAAALAVMAATAANAFLVPTLVGSGIVAATAGVLLSVGGLSSVFARISMGWFADTHVGDNFLRLSALFLAGSVGAWAMFSLGTVPAVSVATGGVILLFGAGWGWNGLFHYTLIQEFPGRPAFATGVTQMGIRLGGVVGPLTFGLLVDGGNPRIAWGAAAGCLTASAIVVLLARAHAGRER